MEEKLLLKCENTIYADEVASLLFEHGIACRQHDERQDTAVGAYGGYTGIAIFVFKKDYATALELVRPLQEVRNHAVPMCPHCGSEDVEEFPSRRRWGSILLISCLVLILAPIVYFAQPAVFQLRSDVADFVALALFFGGWILLFLSRHVNDNCRCKVCGKSFQHFKS